MSMNTRPPLTLSRLRPDLDGLDEEWKQVVDADLRRKAARPPDMPRSISTALRTARYVDRFYVTLSAIVVSLEGQLRMREDDRPDPGPGRRWIPTAAAKASSPEAGHASAPATQSKRPQPRAAKRCSTSGNTHRENS